MAGGKVFGKPGDVRKLSALLDSIAAEIKSTNAVGQSLLDELSGSTRDKAYEDAQKLVNEVNELIGACEAPISSVRDSLANYASFLDSMV
ncbi:MAG: hypothetical protein LUF35_05920 [Lachnospiraceae bacterium]|nr:hypothetical protein [Lachnospiraceae bacterium]